MKKSFVLSLMAIIAIAANAQYDFTHQFKNWAQTPPMGWNSWDCYGPTVVESEVKANADYMAAHLLDYGWEYVVVDIRWFVENDKAGGYNQTNPIYVIDDYGRYTPALNRFPSAANGKGFKPLADYCHKLGLKFGIHLMRGLPKKAAQEKKPVLGAEGITCDMICNNDSACTWLRDNYKVDCTKPGAQQYYNSCFDMYAEWGVDFVKIDDLSRPYHTGEIEMIRHAIDQCGRPIVLSISPGETPIDRVDHVKTHANMWRTVDDFWDNWSQLSYQFQVCAKWAPYIAPGTWPDADMLPLGKISIRGERGAERWTNFTADEQKTMMNLWTIFKSPLMFGGDLPQNDEATNALLTNRDVLYMHHYSVENRQAANIDNKITWTAMDPANGDRFVALFNAGGSEYVASDAALWRSGTISYLTTGHSINASVDLPAGAKELALVVTDGGDGYDCDHADWINPTVTLADGSTVDLTASKMLRSTAGWGSVAVNKNLNGGKLSINGTPYEKGIATHANSILLFDMPEGAVKFTALCGIDNTGSDQGSKSSVEFMVFNFDATMRYEYTDQWSGGNIEVKIDPSKQAATSGYISRTGRHCADIEADITGAQKLWLVVTNGGDDLSYDHADWGNPVLVDANGNQRSLTEIAWDANPINGWNKPQLNKNNDGNTMTIAGKTYDKGFGVNAPSVLSFTLPEGHSYVKLLATVGHDDDVLNAPKGGTMEFRVFTVDPTPDQTAVMPIDMSLIGMDGAKCQITDMWTGETYSDSYAPTLAAHASSLVRVKPLNRTPGAKIEVSEVAPTVEGKSGLMIELKDVPEMEEGATPYIQLIIDGKIVANMPVKEGCNSYDYANPTIEGTVEIVAKFSGSATVDSAVSEPITAHFTSGITSIAINTSEIEVKNISGGLLITTKADCQVPIYTIDGVLFTTIAAKAGANTVTLPAGLYIVAGHKALVD